ncbi:VOC family protein [Ponticoccus sp. SC2-23]|uniref:VOC family protein n=1 Tax=Alexandriicola marinus TaxID=2081710 RepID=UPI000FDA6FF4|nr:VOC family protein [Alexandriicola marinus]MBM1219152.1 VOC family protein [Ponticoccus sp. SC6-9]MBM1223776.1 VOC family protein [Ponticoccus sp. SC6-15]MBM1228966.1 VOC family protein [Ponticoccus sp. SC6-38]MBM1232742.1 VOC family protein [Ponticoccus sp. SC6-45]MBM1237308.1 VOC family protein [Ponticoccus sp. SC6-49]MBM1241753.1 VOC family protein [Ponticoccus sp. SC2-64]MBM1246266.1 VOC family protein [Ponticoccus sp. SC6-42]MBM1250744.1 VOC family protein [Ponticoccus sp. SC6-33]M
MHIEAVAVVVPDYDAGIAFYVGTMGFVLLTDIDLGEGKRWVTVAPPGGGTALLLAQAADDRQRGAIGNQTGGRVGFFLATADFAADHARMTAAGVIFEEQPRQESYGIVAVFRDRFGNRWDLIERY